MSGRILKFVFHHSEVSGFFPSNQSPAANAQPEIAMSRPLMEFTHGEIIAKNGEDRGAGEGPGDRTWQTELQQSQQPGQYSLHFEAAQDKSVPSP